MDVIYVFFYIAHRISLFSEYMFNVTAIIPEQLHQQRTRVCRLHQAGIKGSLEAICRKLLDQLPD